MNYLTMDGRRIGRRLSLGSFAAVWVLSSLFVTLLALFVCRPAFAQAARPAAKPPETKPANGRTTPVGFPQDAGTHDLSSIEWWYFNSFFKTKSGKPYSIVGSFFRVGLPGGKKGHYLLYALADLKANRRKAYSILDQQNVQLLRAFAQLQQQMKPEDPRPFQIIAMLNRDELPRPHQKIPGNATVRTTPFFAIGLANNILTQETKDGRTWHVALNGDEEWTLDLTFTQPERPQMLVGGKGMTGIKRPDEMYYLTLSRMAVTGTLDQDGVIEEVSGEGWLDRQWGSPEFVTNYGWDWAGVQLEDGTDILMFRIRDVNTGNILKIEATVQLKDGTQIIDKPTAYKATGRWTDPVYNIVFPSGFEVVLPKSGYTLTLTPAFPEQTIPVLGVGDAIWEGVINVRGTTKDRTSINGRGYMELVGYKSQPRKPAPDSAPQSSLKKPEANGEMADKSTKPSGK